MKLLVVVDMQKDFVDGSLGTKEAEAIVDGVAKEIGKKKYDKVYVTYDTHQADYLNTNEGKHLPVVHCVEETDGWQLNEKVAKALAKREDVVYLRKPTFGSEELVKCVKEDAAKEAIESITLIGLCTDICVISNALLLKAAFYETEINVIRDLCAGVTPETHEAALTTMKMCQIDIK